MNKEIQTLSSDVTRSYFPGIKSLGILRLDLPDPVAGGNKSYKLKYHLEAFHKSGTPAILSFGGAFSNHIAALAYAGKASGISTIGIIRGDELSAVSNAVLKFAHACGMQLHFVTRETYARRYSPDYHQELKNSFANIYVVPEGGSGEEGVRGCMEILSENTSRYEVIVVPVGTGATFTGLERSKSVHQEVIGVDVVNRNAPFSLGGYAQTTEELQRFIAEMKNLTALPLDHVYSGKTLFAVHQMAKAGSFAGKNLLFVHTGGYAFVGR